MVAILLHGLLTDGASDALAQAWDAPGGASAELRVDWRLGLSEQSCGLSEQSCANFCGPRATDAIVIALGLSVDAKPLPFSSVLRR